MGRWEEGTELWDDEGMNSDAKSEFGRENGIRRSLAIFDRVIHIAGTGTRIEHTTSTNTQTLLGHLYNLPYLSFCNKKPSFGSVAKKHLGAMEFIGVFLCQILFYVAISSMHA